MRTACCAGHKVIQIAELTESVDVQIGEETKQPLNQILGGGDTLTLETGRRGEGEGGREKGGGRRGEGGGGREKGGERRGEGEGGGGGRRGEGEIEETIYRAESPI